MTNRETVNRHSSRSSSTMLFALAGALALCAVLFLLFNRSLKVSTPSFKNELRYTFKSTGRAEYSIERMNKQGDILAVSQWGAGEGYTVISGSGKWQSLEFKPWIPNDVRIFGFNGRQEVAGIYSFETNGAIKTTIFVSRNNASREYTFPEAEVSAEAAAALDEEGAIVLNRLGPSELGYETTRALVIPPNDSSFELLPERYHWFEFNQVLGAYPNIRLFGIAGTEAVNTIQKVPAEAGGIRAVTSKAVESPVIITASGKILHVLSRSQMEPIIAGEDDAVIYRETQTNRFFFLPPDSTEPIPMNLPVPAGAFSEISFLNSRGVAAGNIRPALDSQSHACFAWSRYSGVRDILQQLKQFDAVSCIILGLADDNSLLVRARTQSGRSISVIGHDEGSSYQSGLTFSSTHFR